MNMNKDFWEIPWLSNTEKVRVHILFVSCIRFTVQKYGGVMETDSSVRIATIKIPKNHTIACFEELKELKLIKSDTRPQKMEPVRQSAC
jgi:hypothetical protein